MGPAVTVSVSDHTQAVVDHLNGRDVLTGRGVKPQGAGWQGTRGQSPFVPYSILWRIGAKDSVNLSLADNRGSEARMLLFIRSFGGTVAEAEGQVDAVRQALLDQSLQMPDRSVITVYLDNGQTTTRSDDTEVGLFEAGDFFRVRTVPGGPSGGSDFYGGGY
jgi:hypothetical protein